MNNKENTLDMLNSQNDNFIGIVRQEDNYEDFVYKIDEKIRELDLLEAEIENLDEEKFSELMENKEYILETLKDIKQLFIDMKNDKELLLEITIPNIKDIELDKDYDNDGMSNRDEIKQGRNIMVNEEANIIKNKANKGNEQTTGEIVR